MIRALALAASALALVATGCGSDDKESYVSEFNQVNQTLERTLTSLGSDLTGSTDAKQISGKLDQGANALKKAATDLAEIEPPDDAEGAHDKLVSGVRDLAATFEKGADQAQSGDLAELANTFSSLQGSSGAAKIQEAQKELKDKGYDVDQ